LRIDADPHPPDRTGVLRVHAPGPTLKAPGVAVGAAQCQFDSLAKARRDLFNAHPVRDAKLKEALGALANGLPEEARRIASKFLAKHPRNPDALSILADAAARAGNKRDAEDFLAQSVRCAPDHEACRYKYVVLLMELNRFPEALAETEQLLAKNPTNPLYRCARGHLLDRTRQYAGAADLFRELTAEHPDALETWMGLATALRSLGGHTDEVISALRRVVEIDPGYGTAWWALASLKTFRFSEEDVRLMEAQMANSAVASSERTNLCYALGKACEDIGQFEKSFQYYSKGNAIRRIGADYNPDSTTEMVARARAVFTPELFHARERAGHPSTAPIFVVSMQRSGSTLTEQILGSHSRIESAGELPTLINLVGTDVMPKTGPDYPNGLDRLTAEELRALGEKYLEKSLSRRAGDKSFFVDKNCFNIWQVGLIRLMFPNAKIIDVRRHPIACCWANFSVSFSHAPPLSYKLADIGRFYHDYVRLMAHFDRAQPGKIHRVFYENLVADLEGEVRRMLDYLDLPFEPACLEYYKSERVFKSLSDQQVRQPIFKDGVERWRPFEAWLGPLKAALGPVLDAYPAVPTFAD
jgi:tetratricopeptide (TPR) repeat protein